MPENNIVILRGTLAENPYLETLPNGTAYLRFQLVVERGPSQMPRGLRGKDIQAFDVLRVVRYGVQAEVDYFYLQKGAAVVVQGWNQSRPYKEHTGGREARRMLVEVNAQWIVYERDCNFERGDRQRVEIMARLGGQGGNLPEELSVGLSDALPKKVKSEAE
ncbi:single-stranded DNA-binding protein [Candidatus Kaiserbacteria bacterium]|nr:single-stranded DNA-binding protein [Candidatus Kaiserbacteria bacterium]